MGALLNYSFVFRCISSASLCASTGGWPVPRQQIFGLRWNQHAERLWRDADRITGVWVRISPSSVTSMVSAVSMVAALARNRRTPGIRGASYSCSCPLPAHPPTGLAVWRGTMRGEQLLNSMTKLLGVYRFDQHKVELAGRHAHIWQAHAHPSPKDRRVDDGDLHRTALDNRLVAPCWRHRPSPPSPPSPPPPPSQRHGASHRRGDNGSPPPARTPHRSGFPIARGAERVRCQARKFDIQPERGRMEKTCTPPRGWLVGRAASSCAAE